MLDVPGQEMSAEKRLRNPAPAVSTMVQVEVVREVSRRIAAVRERVELPSRDRTAALPRVKDPLRTEGKVDGRQRHSSRRGSAKRQRPRSSSRNCSVCLLCQRFRRSTPLSLRLAESTSPWIPPCSSVSATRRPRSNGPGAGGRPAVQMRRTSAQGHRTPDQAGDRGADRSETGPTGARLRQICRPRARLGCREVR